LKEEAVVGFEIEVRTNGGRRKELFGELSLKELVEEALKRSSKGEEEARRFWEGFEVSSSLRRQLKALRARAIPSSWRSGERR
jgi:hypothetical protein